MEVGNSEIIYQKAVGEITCGVGVRGKPGVHSLVVIGYHLLRLYISHI